MVGRHPGAFAAYQDQSHVQHNSQQKPKKAIQGSGRLSARPGCHESSDDLRVSKRDQQQAGQHQLAVPTMHQRNNSSPQKLGRDRKVVTSTAASTSARTNFPFQQPRKVVKASTTSKVQQYQQQRVNATPGGAHRSDQLCD